VGISKNNVYYCTYLPIRYLNTIREYVKRGDFRSCGDFIREACRYYFQTEIKNEIKQEMSKKEIHVGEKTYKIIKRLESNESKSLHEM